MKKVLIGMSGGVDSSVAAILLKNQGYEVIGITFQFIDDFDDTDSKTVCETIGTKQYTVDYRKQFKKEIIDPFLQNYQEGITPNPCVECNRKIKLKFLYEEMKKLNCDYIATGHYAKIIGNNLYKSCDENKDQTYFLAKVERNILEKLILPLEGITKEEVRKIAFENHLTVAEKKDSTDVCFITSNFQEYIKQHVGTNQGDIIQIETNKKIGLHNGLAYYTVGQRRGLDIGGMADRLFVVEKDIKNNILYVAEGANNIYLLSDRCIIDEMNWISDEKPMSCTAKFRYRAKEYPVELEYLENGEIKVKYDAIKSVTAGQTCVFYKNDQCLGGGTIKTVWKKQDKI